MSQATNDSKEQRKQARENQQRKQAGSGNEQIIDKKLDGPNRPAD